MCPEVVINFANFSATPTARELTQIEHATGKCVDNAEVVGGTPTYLCKGDGKWYLPSGGCKCKAGFEADMEAQTCISKCIQTVILKSNLRQNILHRQFSIKICS